jgi:adenosylcobyric acid synthase
VTALMVQGTSSWAGKSLLTTALCRHFHRRGIRVAPFKGQNMSNNARVVAGGEIGTAQYLQAVAAGVVPDVRMNPVLVKPETERTSQVVLRGRVDPELSAMAWRARAPELWSTIETSLRELLDAYELVVIEGAGSPAEINLRDTDLANMPVARAADAAVILLADIDRGGALAHLYGTWALLDEGDRPRVRGFVLNKFRGDIALLDPAPRQLAELTGVPTLGVIPMLDHGLPDEDGAALTLSDGTGLRVAVVRYPTASNLDELKAVEQVASVRWVDGPAGMHGADLVILPGSKHVARDLAWLRAQGIEPSLRAHVAAGRRVLGICGGLQMLGEAIVDHSGRDGSIEGLGLLAQRTELAPDKRLASRTEARFNELEGPWAALSHRTVVGYEIRHGRTTGAPAALGGDLGWADGPVLGVYLHGLLEDPTILEAILGAAPERDLETVIDNLANDVMAHLDIDLVERLSGLA